MKKEEIGYWIATGLLCLAMLGGGIADFFHLEPIRSEIIALGYPEYFLTILGTAKIMGVVAVAAPGVPVLKEWAYAGFCFDLLGATASHVFMDDPIATSIKPIFVLGIVVASYTLRPASRRLPR